MSRILCPCLATAVTIVLLICTNPILGDSALDVSPYPIAAGDSVTIQYDPAGRVLEGASQVYLHYGFDGWSPAVDPDPAMSWNAGESVWEATADVSETANQLDCVFHNGGGTWDNNDDSDWHVLVINNSQQWIVDGQLDDGATLVAENNGNKLYAGVRGTILYIAAPGATGGNDHFIFFAVHHWTHVITHTKPGHHFPGQVCHPFQVICSS